jgi:alpha/beta superfamily hydrolase
MTHSLGYRNSAEFIEGEHGRLFAVFHQPKEPGDLAVVVCQPVYAEAARNRRRELALASELCAAGICVARFDYRGSGHSSGPADALRFSEMVEDAGIVVRALLERSGARRVGFVGTRLGALVALQAGAGATGGPMVLWEPPVDLDRYYREVFRARMIGLVKQGERTPSGKAMLEEFARDGFMDVLGNPLSHALYESTRNLSLTDLLIQSAPRPMSIVQMSIKREIKPALSAVIDKCTASGLTVDAITVPYDEAWWFGASGHRMVVETKLTAMDVVPHTVEFMTAAGV